MVRFRNNKIISMLICCTVLICCVSLFYTRTHLYRFPNIKKLVFDVDHRKILNNKVVCDFKQKDMFLINPSELLCNDSNCSSLQMLFIVKSYVLNFGQREAIRRTWGGITKLRSKTVFIIGYLNGIDYLVNLESAKHKDIVQLNKYDQYQNVVYKTIYALLWLSNINITVQFIHFVDDDRFIVPLNMYNVAIQNIESSDLKMLGYMINRSETVRDKSWKTYISPEDYPFDFYPPYIIGGTILTNQKTVRMLAVAVAYTKVIRIEDAYIGIVANSINVKLKHHAAFFAYKQNLTSLRNSVSSPGYETTYILLRDWKLLHVESNSMQLKKKK
ncbi:beta-1,3-galactosyltransferase brn-like [Mytilus edulis]|uniref:beta-1,3-galactosyltransferase brn-like n=1 Tax=Mytilus edulis TaxID=6550 RepID=UPI0039EE66E1